MKKQHLTHISVNFGFFCSKIFTKITKKISQNLKQRNLRLALIILLFGLNFGCTMIPKYQTPKSPIALESEAKDKKSVSQISWEEFFISPNIQNVIKIALENNRDLKIANVNIEEAQAAYGIARSNLLPTISANALETRQGVPAPFSSFTPKQQFRANLTLTSYEIDFFGRLRSLKKAAWEDFLSQEQARNITKISLIAETANSYAQLLCDQEVLRLAEEKLQILETKQNFIEKGFENGAFAKEDFLAAKSESQQAKIIVESYKKAVSQDQNSLYSLLGNVGGKSLKEANKNLVLAVSRENEINQIKLNEAALEFLPSESLLKRPDIAKAEHELKIANANIGAARAAFFPSISLTGTYGYGSRNSKDLFNSKLWSFTPQINIPIFSGGRNLANLNLAKLRKKVQITNYEKAIETAFRESLDQLAEREFVGQQRQSLAEIFNVKNETFRISSAKYRFGINSLLTNISDHIKMLEAKQNLIQGQKQYLANLIALYKVMGGGSEIN